MKPYSLKIFWSAWLSGSSVWPSFPARHAHCPSTQGRTDKHLQGEGRPCLVRIWVERPKENMVLEFQPAPPVRKQNRTAVGNGSKHPLWTSSGVSKHEHASLGGFFTNTQLGKIFKQWHVAKARGSNGVCGIQPCAKNPRIKLGLQFSLSTASGLSVQRKLRRTVTGSYLPLCSYLVTQFPYYLFQKLLGRKISPVLRMFGQSISGGIDMDGNGYPGKLFFFKGTGDKRR